MELSLGRSISYSTGQECVGNKYKKEKRYGDEKICRNTIHNNIDSIFHWFFYNRT